jgi:hypothetical protein
MTTQKHKEVYCQDDIWEDLKGKKPLWEVILKYISNKVGKVLGVSTAWVCV